MARTFRPGRFGALVSLELKDNKRDAAFRFMDTLKLCVRSTSLGDVFTSVLHPATASHRDLSPARRRELGISDGLIRISVGIESVDDIIADIEQALAVSAVATETQSQPPARVARRVGRRRRAAIAPHRAAEAVDCGSRCKPESHHETVRAADAPAESGGGGDR